MDETALKALLAAEIDDALAHVAAGVGPQRRKALDYYLGEPFGNEVEGRSRVVSTDVADTIEWILPALLRIFTATDEVVRFEPTGPEDEEAARQATDYVNWIFTRDNPGFLILYILFKDALLQKNGIAKVWWEERAEATRETYLGKSLEEMQLVLADPDVEPIEHSAREGLGLVRGPDGLPVEGPTLLHDFTVKRTRRRGGVRIAAVPPQEFLISRRARSIEEAAFVAHRVRRTVSELVAQGHDRALVERLAATGEEAADEESAAHAAHDGNDLLADPGLNPAMRELWVTECYIRVDWDGDGIAERRRVTVAGPGCEILDNEPVDGVPFVSLTPIIMPHRFYGLSIADLVMDLQLIKSTILRQILDNLYLSNNGRHVVSDQVNLDDMLTARPGGIIRLKNGALPGQGHVLPLDTPLVAAQAFPMLDYIDGVRENRTGVTRYNQGLDADALNKTASGISQIMSAAQQRLELIARVFAETGIKDLFRKVLELVCKHQTAPRILRLRNRWVAMDPRAWDAGMDMSITVGLGTGNRDQTLAHLQTLLAIQQKAIELQGGADGPIVTLANVYNTLAKLVENAGLKSPEAFFTDPAQAPAPAAAAAPPPPDPALVALGHKAAIEAARLALERRKVEAGIALDRARLGADIALRREALAQKSAAAAADCGRRAAAAAAH
ncbi:MAG: hypothetical protein IRY94_12295 [Rhodospirillaceae bacterium]|nr:hypothetical protein [Rhodospirillaceae bacterium]